MPCIARLPWKGSDGAALKRSLQELGKIRFEEKCVGWILGVIAMVYPIRPMLPA